MPAKLFGPLNWIGSQLLIASPVPCFLPIRVTISIPGLASLPQPSNEQVELRFEALREFFLHLREFGNHFGAQE